MASAPRPPSDHGRRHRTRVSPLRLRRERDREGDVHALEGGRRRRRRGLEGEGDRPLSRLRARRGEGGLRPSTRGGLVWPGGPEGWPLGGQRAVDRDGPEAHRGEGIPLLQPLLRAHRRGANPQHHQHCADQHSGDARDLPAGRCLSAGPPPRRARALSADPPGHCPTARPQEPLQEHHGRRREERDGGEARGPHGGVREAAGQARRQGGGRDRLRGRCGGSCGGPLRPHRQEEPAGGAGGADEQPGPAPGPGDPCAQGRAGHPGWRPPPGPEGDRALLDRRAARGLPEERPQGEDHHDRRHPPPCQRGPRRRHPQRW